MAGQCLREHPCVPGARNGFLSVEAPSSPRLPRGWQMWCLISPALIPPCPPLCGLVPGVSKPERQGGGHICQGGWLAPCDLNCSRLLDKGTRSPKGVSAKKPKVRQTTGAAREISQPQASRPHPSPTPAPRLPLRKLGLQGTQFEDQLGQPSC